MVIIISNIMWVLYLIGCIIAFCLLIKEYKDTPNKERCGISNIIITGIVGVILSWITVWYLCKED